MKGSKNFWAGFGAEKMRPNIFREGGISKTLYLQGVIRRTILSTDPA